MDPLVLSIETCTLAGSLALSRSETLLGVSSGDAKTSHSNTLLKEIDQLFSTTQTELREVDLFAVAVGPGSFTGLRIGVATVKALAATLNKPVVGVSTLEAIALSAGESRATVALLPAGRGEVFVELFSVDEKEVLTALDTPAHLTPERMIERYDSMNELLWSGPGALAQQEVIEKHSGWSLAPQCENLAVFCGELALQKYRLGQVEQAHELRAIYVRPSDAELKK
jgi:tRNA threonylcarbamoyladenosine biosynthesis protein TsaB